MSLRVLAVFEQVFDRSEGPSGGAMRVGAGTAVFDRAALARETLRRAEQDLGVRRGPFVERSAGPHHQDGERSAGSRHHQDGERSTDSRHQNAERPPAGSSADVAVDLASARVRRGGAPLSNPGPYQTAPRRPARHRPVPPIVEGGWPVPDSIAPLLPGGVLRPGSVAAVCGSAGLLLALLAAPSTAGAWVVVVGHPELGILAARDAGVDLERFALVPAPGPEAATTVAALLDGVDLVVVGPDAGLTDADRRRLTARARERSAVLVPAGPWPGAHVVLTARVGAWVGTDRGSGWLRRRTLLVERSGRAGAAERLSAEIEVPLGADPLAFLAVDAPAVSAQTPANVSPAASVQPPGTGRGADDREEAATGRESATGRDDRALRLVG